VDLHQGGPLLPSERPGLLYRTELESVDLPSSLTTGSLMGPEVTLPTVVTMRKLQR
jgi:hypothetical protein